jgi:hypothetical protein
MVVLVRWLLRGSDPGDDRGVAVNGMQVHIKPVNVLDGLGLDVGNLTG